MDKGIVEGKIYKNPSIGLELTPAPELQLRTPELKGTPGTLSEQLSVAALGEQKWFSTRDSVFLDVDVLASNPPEERSAEAGMSKAIRVFREEGFEPVNCRHEERLGRVEFLRQDIRKGSTNWTVMTKTCDALELLLIFTGSGQDDVNRVVASTQMKIDLARTGCSPNANNVTK